MNKTKIEWTDYSWNPITGCEHGCDYCIDGESLITKSDMSVIPIKDQENIDRVRERDGVKRIHENKECPSFLGVHVAERVLSHVFKDVQRMPNCNPGFDFICNKGMKIDVKSSCIQHRENCTQCWKFHINKNTTADYFLCVSFDNREDLNPLYVWLLTGSKVNHLASASISTTTINKWGEYRLSLDKIKTCCDVMKTGPIIRDR